MTMPTLARELPRHEERYVRSWQVIDQLVNFGMKEDAQELPAFADLQPEAVQTLLTPNGRAELALWIEAFRRSIELMRRFNTERAAGTVFNASDWKLMDESAAKALDALKIRLLDLATHS